MAKNKRPYRDNYSVNNRATKWGEKVEQAIKHYKTLQRREKIEGKTTWIANAFEIVLIKLKKYGIKTSKII
jgi:hypothetical protein